MDQDRVELEHRQEAVEVLTLDSVLQVLGIDSVDDC